MKNALKILIFIVAMGTVSGVLLVGVNSFTLPLITKNEELKLKTAVLEVLEIDHTVANALKVFTENVKVMNKDKHVFYNGPDGSIAFEFSGPGLWGPISGTISLEKDLKTIRKMKITHQEETPGLGGRIVEENYLRQFRHKEAFPKLVFLPEGKSRGLNEVDAITGATGSSRALEKLINENVREYISVFQGRVDAQKTN